MAEYIEREALIKRLEVTPILKPHFEFDEYIRKGIIDLVKRQPAADVVEVRHGEWETKEVLSEPGEAQKYNHFHKECKYFYVDYGIGGHYYCPLCGAKMDGKGGAECLEKQDHH